MKKFFKGVVSLLLLISMSVALMGCAKEKKEITIATGKTAKGALEGVTLKVGTSGLFAPFSYYDEDGTTLIGYDLDFLKDLQDYLGFKIDGDVQAMDYSTLTTSVASGKLDIAMAALCATDERKEKMNFTDTYYDSGQILCINKEASPAELTSVEDLKSGKFIVAVEKGTASDLYIQKLGVPTDKVEVHDTITTAYESLEQGKVDCLIQDTPGMAYYIKTVKGTKLAMIGDEFNNGQAPYAVAISFDCSKKYKGIVDALNQAIKELTEAGTMKEINTKWCE
jgi:ABC-type amino acid transport/signal transduction systems, periplasmic component/domain